jgi:uncharacterized protein YbjT (DUF2867 family)
MSVVFVTGGTGYLGRPLIELLAARGHRVRALVRPGSERKLPAGCEPVTGDALDGASYAASVAPADIFVHLVGVPHPSPRKAPLFRTVDLASTEAAVANARAAGAGRFVYVSVAQPAPVMQAYVAARVAGETLIRASGMNASFVRPWYVLGPGHHWPYLLLPFYGLASLFPGSRATARRLALVTRAQMLAALVREVESAVPGVTIVDVAGIKTATLSDVTGLSRDGNPSATKPR